MIEKLIKYNKNELSFSNILRKKRTTLEKRFALVPFFYLLLLILSVLVVFIDSSYAYISIIILVLIILDTFLFAKCNKGLFNYFHEINEKNNLSILNSYNKKTKFKSVHEGYDVIREKKLLLFFKQNDIKKKDSDFILSSLRHRETIELTVFLIVFGALMIGFITFSTRLVEFFVPIENLKELKVNVEQSSQTQEQKKNLIFQIKILVIIIFATISFLQVFPYLLANTFFELKFKALKELQRLIENIHLK